jgi:hypothetical protein
VSGARPPLLFPTAFGWWCGGSGLDDNVADPNGGAADPDGGVADPDGGAADPDDSTVDSGQWWRRSGF